MITEYDRFSEEEDVFKKTRVLDALKSDNLSNNPVSFAQDPAQLAITDQLISDTANDFANGQMGNEKKALHQITVGEKGDGINTDLNANVGYEDQFKIDGGTDLEANNNVDP